MCSKLGTKEAETGRPQGQPGKQLVPGQPQLHSVTLSQKIKNLELYKMVYTCGEAHILNCYQCVWKETGKQPRVVCEEP